MPRTYNSVRASYFNIRVINEWNSLPADRVDFSSFASVKRTVKQVDFTPFLYAITFDWNITRICTLYIIISLLLLFLLLFSYVIVSVC